MYVVNNRRSWLLTLNLTFLWNALLHCIKNIHLQLFPLKLMNHRFLFSFALHFTSCYPYNVRKMPTYNFIYWTRKPERGIKEQRLIEFLIKIFARISHPISCTFPYLFFSCFLIGERKIFFSQGSIESIRRQPSFSVLLNFSSNSFHCSSV